MAKYAIYDGDELINIFECNDAECAKKLGGVLIDEKTTVPGKPKTKAEKLLLEVVAALTKGVNSIADDE